MKSKLHLLLAIGVMVSILLVGCAAPAPQAAPQVVEKVVTQVVEKPVEVEKVVTQVVEKPVEKIVEKVVEVPKAAGELTVWAFYDLTDEKDARAVMMKQAVDTFQATTGIKVNYQQVAWDQLPKKIALQAQAKGDMPDVVLMAAESLQGLVNAGALMDISQQISEASWYGELSDFEKSIFEIEGGRYGVGMSVQGGNWYYNVADFPNGIPAKAADWEKEAERLKGEGKYIATMFMGKGASGAAVVQGYAPMFASNGGHLFDDEGKPDWALPENVAVVEWMRSLLTKGYLPEVAFTGDWSASEVPFVEKKAAAVRGGSWSYLYINGLKERYEAKEVVVAAPPAFGDKGYVFMNSEAWGVTSGAKNVDNAIAWINFFMNPSILAPWASANYAIPTTEAALGNALFTSSEFYKATADNLFGHGKPPETSPFYNESVDALAIALQELMLDPKADVMAKLKQTQDEVIKKYW